MITLRPAQLEAMDLQVLKELAKELRPALAERYPHCLPLFPEEAQEQIVLNMLGRGGTWGLTWRSSLAVFAEWMLAIAPNFDEEREIRTVLGQKRFNPNRAMLVLNLETSRKAWRGAQIIAHDLPLFLAPKWLGTPLLKQTAAALPLALGEHLGQAGPRVIAKAALSLAESLGLGAVPDAALVVATWRALYGPQYRDETVFPWLADVLSKQHAPALRVALLKRRIHLDHQRFV